jgi:DNA-binding NarL/FixJ family response regulator
MVARKDASSVSVPISVVIVENRPVFSAGLRRLLSEQSSIDIVTEIFDVRMVSIAPMNTPPDVLLLSHGFGENLDEILRAVCTAFPRTPVVLYGIPGASDGVIAALRLGVKGFIDEDSSVGDLITAIHVVAQGQTVIAPRLASNLAALDSTPLTEWAGSAVEFQRLTLRELEVLQLVAHGLTNRCIAASIGLSEHTVRAHLREVMRKLKARSRIEAVSLGIRLKLIQPMNREDPTRHRNWLSQS